MKKKFWPQPTTPLRGDVAEITFDLYQLARGGRAPAAVQRLFDTCGAYQVKPKRCSRGVVWNNFAFWWSFKGYYRPGSAEEERRPLQHYIWMWHHCEPMPPKHEIWFRDRDHHNFAVDNLELLHKADVHRRCVELGECRSLSFEERSIIRGTWACRMSRERTALLLKRAQTERSNQHGLITAIYGRQAA